MSGPAGWQVFLQAIEREAPERQASRLAGLALQMARHGDRAGAAAQALRARDLAKQHGADDPNMVTQALRNLTAGYHINISTDPDRIAAWSQAITAQLRPGMLVLEIGTGSGILTMLAARAGAEVISCESDPVIAAIARDIVAANGLADRVTVIVSRNDTLRLGRDLPRPADVLMMDLFGDRLFDFAPFRAVAESRPLLRDNALMLPMQVSLNAALADFSRWKRLVPGTLAGFDLTGLDAVGYRRLSIEDHTELTLRSGPERLLQVDLAGPLPAIDGSVVCPLVSDGGTVNGVATWISLTLAPGCVLEPRPGETPRGFYARPHFNAFDAVLTTRPGDSVPVSVAWCDRKSTVTLAC